MRCLAEFIKVNTYLMLFSSQSAKTRICFIPVFFNFVVNTIRILKDNQKGLEQTQSWYWFMLMTLI